MLVIWKKIHCIDRQEINRGRMRDFIGERMRVSIAEIEVVVVFHAQGAVFTVYPI